MATGRDIGSGGGVAGDVRRSASVRACPGPSVLSQALPGAGRARFTLIELILVMVLMLVVVAMVTPRLSGFAKRRAVLEEGRRLVAASRWAGSEAAAQGIYMQLSFDLPNRRFTVEAAPGWTLREHAPLVRVLDPGVALVLPAQTEGAEVPAVVFHPDGTTEGEAPATVLFQDRFDASCQVALSWEAGQSAYRFAETGSAGGRP